MQKEDLSTDITFNPCLFSLDSPFNWTGRGDDEVQPSLMWNSSSVTVIYRTKRKSKWETETAWDL
jgi:hypothetical protein